MARLSPALWRDMMDYLRNRHTSLCRQWFEELEPVELDNGLLQIGTANAVHQNYLQRKCVDQFTEAAQDVTGNLVAVKFVVIDATKAGSRGNGAQKPPFLANPAKHPTKSNGQHPQVTTVISTHGDHDLEFDQMVITPDNSFENFVTGPNNQLAYAAAVAVANQPGTAYNPLFIHGGVGLGKTHLLQAICQQILQMNSRQNIYYVSCDAFMNQFIECVKQGRMSEFRDRYRHVDVLVIDDIHFLSERERSQEEFFHTFNALYQLEKQIVLSSDSPPHEIPKLEDRLVSRFKWGLIAEVTKPSYETRVAIVQNKASLRNVAFPDDVVQYLASRIDSNARDLEGAIINVIGHANLQNKSIDLAVAREALNDPDAEPRQKQITLQNIIDAVTNFYSVKLSDLQSKRRHKSITQPRQVCMWLARRHTRFSLEEIGGYFGGRDHTTVMHSIKTVDDRISTDPNFGNEIDTIEKKILERA